MEQFSLLLWIYILLTCVDFDEAFVLPAHASRSGVLSKAFAKGEDHEAITEARAMKVAASPSAAPSLSPKVKKSPMITSTENLSSSSQGENRPSWNPFDFLKSDDYFFDDDPEMTSNIVSPKTTDAEKNSEVAPISTSVTSPVWGPAPAPTSSSTSVSAPTPATIPAPTSASAFAPLTVPGQVSSPDIKVFQSIEKMDGKRKGEPMEFLKFNSTNNKPAKYPTSTSLSSSQFKTISNSSVFSEPSLNFPVVKDEPTAPFSSNSKSTKFKREVSYEKQSSTQAPTRIVSPLPKVEKVQLSGSIPRRFYVAPSNYFDLATASAQFLFRLGSGAFVDGYKPEIVQEVSGGDGTYSILRVFGQKVKEAGKELQVKPKRLIEIYEFEGCPFCRKVREAVSILDMDVLFKPCPRGGTNFRLQTKKLGGKMQFPYMVDPNTGVSMYGKLL